MKWYLCWINAMKLVKALSFSLFPNIKLFLKFKVWDLLVSTLFIFICVHKIVTLTIYNDIKYRGQPYTIYWLISLKNLRESKGKMFNEQKNKENKYKHANYLHIENHFILYFITFSLLFNQFKISRTFFPSIKIILVHFSMSFLNDESTQKDFHF